MNTSHPLRQAAITNDPESVDPFRTFLGAIEKAADGTTMSLNLNEGDELLLPCRNCATLCIPFSVLTDTSTIICPRCFRESEVICERRKDGWAIRVMFDGELVTIWE